MMLQPQHRQGLISTANDESQKIGKRIQKKSNVCIFKIVLTNTTLPFHKRKEAYNWLIEVTLDGSQLCS